MSQRTRLLELLVERSLSLGEFTLASGARSSYYIDARRTTMSAEGQFLVGTVALEALRREGISPSWVGGLTMGADPISYCIAHRSWMEGAPCDAFSVRKEAKGHGSGRRIEGGLPADARVVIVEDTLTSGRSALQAVDAVREHGAEILAVLTLVDREAGGGEEIHRAGLPLIRLFTASEILEAAGPEISPPAEGA